MKAPTSVIKYRHTYENYNNTGYNFSSEVQEYKVNTFTHNIAAELLMKHLEDGGDELLQMNHRKITLNDNIIQFSFYDHEQNLNIIDIEDFRIVEPGVITIIVDKYGKVAGIAGVPKDCDIFVKQEGEGGCTLTTVPVLHS